MCRQRVKAVGTQGKAQQHLDLCYSHFHGSSSTRENSAVLPFLPIDTCKQLLRTSNFGAKAPAFFQPVSSGLEQRSHCVSTGHLWSEVWMCEFPTMVWTQNSSCWYTNTIMFDISGCFDKCDWKQEYFWVLSLFGHVFYWLLCPTEMLYWKQGKECNFARRLHHTNSDLPFTLGGGNQWTTVLFPIVLPGRVLMIRVGWTFHDGLRYFGYFRHVETAVFMCTTQ